MKFLIVQTAFIGDVILATPIIEKLHHFFPDAQIDFLLRRGNENLLADHPHVRRCWIWEKKKEKYRSLFKLIGKLRRERFDWIINCQRFSAAGLLTILSNAHNTVGFDKNPFSRIFTKRVSHIIGSAQKPVHEVARNLLLIQHLTNDSFWRPRLYPSQQDYSKASQIAPLEHTYVCVAPTSVWFTKQYPAAKWVELLNQIPDKFNVFLLGGPGDTEPCQEIARNSDHPKIQVLAGQLNFLESAALMQKSAMNYVNDSAPMHLASAVDAPVAAVFCSTMPYFGFTPLSTEAYVIESQTHLTCRPCGLHGRRACPERHFACAASIHWTQFPVPG